MSSFQRFALVSMESFIILMMRILQYLQNDSTAASNSLP